MLRHGKSKIERPLICLPTFHSEISWLERSTKSVEMQTYPYFDCFIVKDSCSKCLENCIECNKCVETKKYCLSLVKKDSRFRYYNLPLHCSGAGWGPRNFAILNTDNNLIAYLDDDNWYESDHIECLINSIKNNSSDIAYTGTRLYDHKNRTIKERLHKERPKQGYIDTSEIMHRRWLINKYGGWRYVKKCNDWDLISRWKDYKWSHTNKITLNFFVREGCGIHRK